MPLDLNTLTALKRCSLGLDLYLWTAYRTFALTRPLRAPGGTCTASSEWSRTGPVTKKTVQNFRGKILQELKKIKLAWPGLNYSTAPGVLILYPSTPAIPPSDHRQLVS